MGLISPEPSLVENEVPVRSGGDSLKQRWLDHVEFRFDFRLDLVTGGSTGYGSSLHRVENI